MIREFDWIEYGKIRQNLIHIYIAQKRYSHAERKSVYFEFKIKYSYKNLLPA